MLETNEKILYHSTALQSWKTSVNASAAAAAAEEEEEEEEEAGISNSPDP